MREDPSGVGVAGIMDVFQPCYCGPYSDWLVCLGSSTYYTSPDMRGYRLGIRQERSDPPSLIPTYSRLDIET